MADTSPPIPPATAPGSARDGGGFSPLLVAHCASTAKWVQFIAVLTTVVYALIIVASLGMVIAGLTIPSVAPLASTYGAGASVVLFLAYLAAVGIYVPALVHLYRYAAWLRAFVVEPDGARLERAIGFQKSFWKYVGILCIVGLAFAVFSLVVLLPLSRAVS